MTVTSTLSLGDPLEQARAAAAEMLQSRERTFSPVSYTHLTLPTIYSV